MKIYLKKNAMFYQFDNKSFRFILNVFIKLTFNIRMHTFHFKVSSGNTRGSESEQFLFMGN